MSDKVIEVKGLRFRYRVEEPLIEDLSFEVFRGEFFGILGPNGAGKSTLLRLILGFLKPLSGEIKLFGESIDRFFQWGRIGYVPQRFSVERAFTGNVGELLKAVAPKERVGWIIAFLHLENLLKKPFVKLSGGEQQKVLLAMALTTNPDLLVLDEPMTGLDIHAQEHIQQVLKDLSKDRTVVVVSHDVGFVLKNATRILCLGMPYCKVVEPGDIRGVMKDLFGLH
ncbi:MAG: metal ABC transporter ATP-binding protein [Aquificaceae bacterium]|nr:metal ABC transporter ATP-binding protein [Aquificaceae bacterium]MCX7806814.1 metal ABC transporter ATP-binding protein [Planctomycetota bacterium]MDW8066485.1 metal ABC transporter ATP-binding protein [Aquificaceae bacterium]MDW8423923.1 metal ABC transporter ATP-binding protein [Aquificaceae bacterium]